MSYCRISQGHPWHGPYHDREYGFPIRSDAALLERLALEINQAGLSWLTMLVKRENFRKAFDQFVPEKIVRYTPKKVERLMADAGIVRNRSKIDVTIVNARLFLDVVAEFGSFETYLATIVPPPPRRLPPTAAAADIPVTSAASDALSADLRRRGFRFVGSTIMYAHMQSIGLVDDHLPTCFRYAGEVVTG